MSPNASRTKEKLTSRGSTCVATQFWACFLVEFAASAQVSFPWAPPTSLFSWKYANTVKRILQLIEFKALPLSPRDNHRTVVRKNMYPGNVGTIGTRHTADVFHGSAFVELRHAVIASLAKMLVNTVMRAPPFQAFAKYFAIVAWVAISTVFAIRV